MIKCPTLKAATHIFGVRLWQHCNGAHYVGVQSATNLFMERVRDSLPGAGSGLHEKSRLTGGQREPGFCFPFHPSHSPSMMSFSSSLPICQRHLNNLDVFSC